MRQSLIKSVRKQSRKIVDQNLEKFKVEAYKTILVMPFWMRLRIAIDILRGINPETENKKPDPKKPDPPKEGKKV